MTAVLSALRISTRHRRRQRSRRRENQLLRAARPPAHQDRLSPGGRRATTTSARAVTVPRVSRSDADSRETASATVSPRVVSSNAEVAMGLLEIGLQLVARVLRVTRAVLGLCHRRYRRRRHRRPVRMIAPRRPVVGAGDRAPAEGVNHGAVGDVRLRGRAPARSWCGPLTASDRSSTPGRPTRPGWGAGPYRSCAAGRRRASPDRSGSRSPVRYSRGLASRSGRPTQGGDGGVDPD